MTKGVSKGFRSFLGMASAAALLGAMPAHAAMSCDAAEAKLRADGYQIISKDCAGKTYTFSTMKGEAVLVKVDAKTGRMKKLLGGD
jgi:hypothetical protein